MERERRTSRYKNRRAKQSEIRTHCVIEKLLKDLLAETKNPAGNQTKAQRAAALSVLTGIWLWCHSNWQPYAEDSTVVSTWLSTVCSLTIYVLHFSIFTATFVLDWEWVRPYAVASTTLPKAPDPRVRPETQRKAQWDGVWMEHMVDLKKKGEAFCSLKY